MKHKIYTLAFILFISTQLLTAQNCTTAVSNTEFQQKFSQLTMQKTDENKLAISKSFLDGRCFTAIQIRQMASLYSDDSYRLDFTQSAYNKVIDKNNFFDVFDAFATYSAVFRLYDFVKAQTVVVVNTNTNTNTTVNYKFPVLNYPSCNGYKGRTGCSIPIADNDFEKLAKPMFDLKTDDARKQAAFQMMQTQCLSMAQTMKLGTLFEMESNRLGFMKEAFAKVYDQENYAFAAEVFSHGPYKTDWLSYCNIILNPIVVNDPPPPPPVMCEVTTDDFNAVKKKINAEISANTKFNLAKTIIASKKCFTSEQIKELCKLMSFESDKLSLAKYAYDYCIDVVNYYVVNEAFSFSSSKNDLMKFINSKKQ